MNPVKSLVQLSHRDRGPVGGQGTGEETVIHEGGDGAVLEEDHLLSALLAVTRDKGRPRVGGGRGYHGATVGRKNRSLRILSTRLLDQHPALLDDLCPGLADAVLSKVHRWEFNAFLLDRVTGGRCLPTICLHILYKTGLLNQFKMDPTVVLSFFRLVEHGYHTGNPYHNSLHACDVTQAMHVFCEQTAVLPHLPPLEMLAALVAAVSHDLDHPGVNEKFLVNTGSHLAVLYDNVSVLENHHWRSAIGCFVDSGLSRYLTTIQFNEFTDLVRTLILATDISRHSEFLEQFKHFLSTGELDIAVTHYRHFILQIGIKCADISNPCRVWEVSRLWSMRACEEFFRQGDLERELSLLVTPICDRFNMTVANVQVGFYNYVVKPLFQEWDRFLCSSLSRSMLRYFYQNQRKWEEEVMQERGLAAVVVVDGPPTSTCCTKVEAGGSTTEEEEDQDTTSPLPTTGEPLEEPNKRQVMGVRGGERPSTIISTGLSCLERRMSLPNHDPLHRIFDQMLQPDTDQHRQVHLKRNFSLTDRRRSSLLRGLYNRSSLKPSRGRVNRPTSVCLENVESSSSSFGLSTSLSCRTTRTLQPRENLSRLDDPSCIARNLGEEEGRGRVPQQQLGGVKSDQLERVEGEETVPGQKQQREKENNNIKISLYERLTQRRGSAPSNLVLGDSKIPNVANLVGSSHTSLLRQQQANLCLSSRRGSLPSELINDSLPKQLRSRHQNTPPAAKNKGLLRRRSMGPELLTVQQQSSKDRPFVQKYLNI